MLKKKRMFTVTSLDYQVLSILRCSLELIIHYLPARFQSPAVHHVLVLQLLGQCLSEQAGVYSETIFKGPRHKETDFNKGFAYAYLI